MGASPGIQFSGKLLSELLPRGPPLASVHPRLSTVPACSAVFFQQTGLSQLLLGPCPVALSCPETRGSPGLSRSPESLQPLLGACRSADTRKGFPCRPHGSPSVSSFFDSLPSLSPVSQCRVLLLDHGAAKETRRSPIPWI